MNYQELKNALKKFKSEGLTDIRLNSSKADLQAEYDRLVKDNTGEVTVSSSDAKESHDADIVRLEESQQAIAELKEDEKLNHEAVIKVESDEHEKLNNEAILKVESDEKEHPNSDQQISDLLENAYREIEENSDNVNSQSMPKFQSVIFVLLTVISIIGLIFATEKFISNVKFLSEMSKFSF